jgi:hypothetical protein
MADHQRIHPVDLEAGRKPSAPLMPGGSFRSDKGDPAAPPRGDHHHQQQRSRGPGGHLPAPPSRVAPRGPPLPPPPKRRGGCGCCCRFLCCLVLTAVVLAVLAAAALGALYLAFSPKAPRYSVDRLAVTAFQVDPATLTARARFGVTVTAVNPNERIGIHYERGSDLGVWYRGTRLARGALPAFYQGHRNTTVLDLDVAGEVRLGSEAVSALQDAQRTGAVPLLFRADVPVRVQLGGLKIWKVTSRVKCDLVVDRLMDVAGASPIKIKTSNCKFSLKL